MARRTIDRPVWLSLQEAGDEFGVSVKTITRRVREGALPAYRFGGRVRVKAEDLDALAKPIPAASFR